MTFPNALLAGACSAFLFALASTDSAAQVNISSVGHLSYADLHNGSHIANLWGYTDEFGNEYALVGVNGNGGETGGISVVDLSDPADPQEVFFHPGPTSIWREIKVWEDHAYMTTEADNGGLIIVDLSPLPQSNELSVTHFFDPAWDTSHSLFIDENGRLFIHGANEGNGGAIMYDLTQDPEAPVRLGQFDQWYVHDSFARGDTLYAGHITNGFFSIVDVSDPANPVLLGQQNTPNNFTHNTWLDASGRYLYTTDERENAYVGAYDVSDPADIQFMDKLQSDPGSNAIPHNTYWLPGDHVVQSYYTYGVSIYDVSHPENMVEVGSYDTSPLTGGGFFGAWGVYPYFPSGRLIVSDIEQGLFILEPTYARACWLEGAVTSSAGGSPVAQASVALTGSVASDITGIDGLYSTGLLQPGSYTLTVSAPGYFPATIEGVVLQTGETTLQDVQLVPLPTYVVSGAVITSGTGESVPGAQVWMVNSTYSWNTTTAADGTFTFPAVYDGSYTVDIGAWGWHGACPADVSINGAGLNGWTVELERGYADDFALDLGWSVQSTASRGRWSLGDPAGTVYQGAYANPEVDVEGDCRDRCYDTGNSGGNPNSDDLDEGWTLLTSPVFDATGLTDPHIRYHYWFINTGGSTPRNDSLVISLTDGTDTVAIQTLTAEDGNMSAWRFSNIRMADHLSPSASMRLLVHASDMLPDQHIVEAAFDAFELVPEATTSMVDLPASEVLAVWPNPSSGTFSVRTHEQDARLEVLDAVGRAVTRSRSLVGGMGLLKTDLPAGAYTVVVTGRSGTRHTARIVIAR
ncbi:MAG: choice-of-anchor B family protein [Flavobacteriales bacterium]|nr:choice-of-anchor B family protein [Flavobacteriales bacterium]